MNDRIYVVTKPSIIETKVERSVFIGQAAPAGSEDEAREFVATVRSQHRQANHNPFAYIVRREPEPTSYFHDHGEPAGTAGKPILGAISRQELVNTVVVVTRYFGGRKLGVRGLIEAYGDAATLALNSAEPDWITLTGLLFVTLDYPSLDQALYCLAQHKAEVITRDFGPHVDLTVRIALSRREALSGALAPLSRMVRAD